MVALEEEKKSQDSASNADMEGIHWSNDPEKAYFREMIVERQGSGVEVDSVLGNDTIDGIYNGKDEGAASSKGGPFEDDSLGFNPRSIRSDDDSLGFSAHAPPSEADSSSFKAKEQYDEEKASVPLPVATKEQQYRAEEDSLGFKEQRRGNDEDSLGFMEPSRKPSSSSRGARSKEQINDEDSLGYAADPNAPLRLAILGPEDDLSTIAGDTIGGQTIATEGAVFSNANLEGINKKGNMPIQRDFKEYDLNTPTKKKKRRWHPYLNREDDDDTQPETPPGVVRGGNSKAADSDKDIDASTYFTYIRPSKKVFICAAIMGVVLMLLIGGLAIAYSQVKKDSDGEPDEIVFGGFKPEDLAPVLPNKTEPTVAPVAAPVVDPVVDDETTGAPTRTPISLPTKAPVPVPVNAFAELETVLASQNLDVDRYLEEPDSPQFRSMQWLAADPAFFDYTESRVVQRWALSVLAHSMTIDDTGVYTAGAYLPGWLDYDSNECDWFSTSDGNVCNGFGFYQTLDLQDQQFYGTIPAEVSLLSGSLQILDLRGNNLDGQIPTQVGLLPDLRRLQLTNNALSGEIPTTIGLLNNVATIGLGRNALTGTIPNELGNLGNLVNLDLAVNNLNGEVPVELGDLESLVTLRLGGNNLSGDVPRQVCRINVLENFSADCHLVECECCTECAPTPQPTGAPTVETMAPTAEPTKATTASPTASPEECKDTFIEWGDECMDGGSDLMVSFSNCDAQSGDWVGIFEKDAEPDQLPDPILWVWTCGSQDCDESPSSNTVILNENDQDTNGAGTWPLEKGDYFAYLTRNAASPPYEAFASSEKLKLKGKQC